MPRESSPDGDEGDMFPDPELVLDPKDLRRHGIHEEPAENELVMDDDWIEDVQVLRQHESEMQALKKLMGWPVAWEDEQLAPSIGRDELEDMRLAARSELQADAQLAITKLTLRFRSWHEAFLRCLAEAARVDRTD